MSFKLKTLLIIISIQFLCLFLLGWGVLHYIQNSYQHELTQRAQLNAEWLADEVAPTLAKGQRKKNTEH